MNWVLRLRVESLCSNMAVRGIQPLICHISSNKLIPDISVNNPEIEGLASLSVSAFFLRLICTNGMVAKTEISASYRHVSTKILIELPQVFEKVSYELGKQQDRFRLSLESPVDDPLATLARFNKQFALKELERESVAWAWPQEMGDTMFHLVNTYTRAAAMDGLTAESSYRLQRVGGEVLGCSINRSWSALYLMGTPPVFKWEGFLFLDCDSKIKHWQCNRVMLILISDDHFL